MSAFAQGNLFHFNLNGTAVLPPSLVNCVWTINAHGIAAATNFTAVANVTPKLASPPPLTFEAWVCCPGRGRFLG
jgi:hypothetical protein